MESTIVVATVTRLAVDPSSKPAPAPAPATARTVVLVAPERRREAYPYRTVIDSVRYPENRFAPEPPGEALAVALIADADAEYRGPWREVADILLCAESRLPGPAGSWIAGTLARYPGAGLAAVEYAAGRSVCGLRDGRLVTATAITPLGGPDTPTAGGEIFAAFLHGWLASGNPVEALGDAVLLIGGYGGRPHPGRLPHRVRVGLGRWSQRG